MYSRICIIPHADKKFAGDIRYNVFKNFDGNNIKMIYYLATVHKWTNKLLPLYIQCQGKYILPTIKAGGPKLDNEILEEHSYTWVKDELQEYFPNAEHCVFYPTSEKIIIDLAKTLQIVLENEPDSIVIATTDLTHYGKQYGFVTPEVRFLQLEKIRKEAPLIESLIKPNEKRVAKILNEFPYVADAPIVLRIVAALAHGLNLRGIVADYYDSSWITNPIDKNGKINNLDKYTISWNLNPRVDSFVSYVGIYFIDDITDINNFNTFDITGISNFDIMQAIGILRSTISIKVLYGEINQLFPKWSIWNKKWTTKFGVFVGTEVMADRHGTNHWDNIFYTTNCSYGQFPGAFSKITLASKIISAANNCPNDAKYRWQIPYTEKLLGSPDAMKYKIEILEPESEWITIVGKDNILSAIEYLLWLKDGIDDSELYGIRLTVPDVGSATYLPIVAKEWQSSAKEYLISLTKKLGGKGDEWMLPDSYIEIYYTYVYHFPLLKKVGKILPNY